MLLLGAERLQAAAFRFILSFDPSVSKSPFSGRVYIFLMPREFSGPPRGVSWFNPEPIFARDIKDWKPGESLILDDKALAYPLPLAKLKKTTYWVAAVMDFDAGDRSFSAAPGNGSLGAGTYYYTVVARRVAGQTNKATSSPSVLLRTPSNRARKMKSLFGSRNGSACASRPSAWRPVTNFSFSNEVFTRLQVFLELLLACADPCAPP